MHFLCLLDGYPGLVWRNARTCFTTNDELYERRLLVMDMFSDSKVHGDNKGPTWVLSAPDRPHIGPMNLAIRVITSKWNWDVMIHDCFKIIIHCSAVITFRQSHYLLHLHYLCNIMQPALTLMYSLCFGNDNFYPHPSGSFAIPWGMISTMCSIPVLRNNCKANLYWYLWMYMINSSQGLLMGR